MSPPAAPPASASELNPPDPAAVERFRRDLDALIRRATGEPLDDAARVALAVSGGADSMAMLVLAAAALPGRVIAATVDHGLRAGSAAEAELVAGLCATLGVPHRTLAPLRPITGASVQKQARQARYEAMAAWLGQERVGLLLTAHHADDQAETLLMRLNRASGATGLSGIRPIRQDGSMLVLRPLLRWRRHELREIALTAGIVWAEDPSNADLRHDRTRYRDFLSGQSLLSAGALAAAAAHIEETDSALAFWVDQLWAARWDGSRLDVGDLPREALRRLVRQAILTVRADHGLTAPHFSNASNIEALIESLVKGRTATQGGIIVAPDGPEWHFTLAPPRRSQ